MKKMSELTKARQAAIPYLQELESAGVPYSITPEFSQEPETYGDVIGIQVAVDAISTLGWALWVVRVFLEDAIVRPSFALSGGIVQEFEHSSLSDYALARGLADCRAGHNHVKIEDRSGFSILTFPLRPKW